MTQPTDAEVLATFDRQVRQSLAPPQTGWETERAGQVIRTTAPEGAVYGCYVEWSHLDESTVDAAIAEQLAYYGGLGRRFEWKTYSYDGPGDLTTRLAAAGFEAEEEEALVIGLVDVVVAACQGAVAPPGVVIRPVTDGDWDGIAALHRTVWGVDSEEWVQGIITEVRTVPDTIDVLVADAGGVIASAGWIRYHAGTDFASLWGGSTLPEWRRKGIYRALVGQRADLAAERGFRYLQVDASPNSRPILERLGLRVVATTTPYVWTPPAS